MTEAPEGLGTRLRRTKLVQWAVAYLAGAWLTLQFLDVVGDRFGLPDSAFRIVVTLLAIGLLATLVLAWYHGEKGEQRVSGMELAMFAVLAVVGGAAVMLVRGRSEAAVVAPASTATAEPAQASLVVLPFADLSPGGDQEYFSDGITEEILNVLVQLPGLRVPGRTTSFSFKGKDLSIAEIAQQLGVAHVLEGSVRKAGDRVRITAQLIDAGTDAHLWSQAYDRELTDVFAVQEEIARAIVDALQVRLGGPAEARIAAEGSGNPEAHDLYLRGRFAWSRRGGENIGRAIDLYERALQSDPGFARAWAALAEARAQPNLRGVPPAAELDKAAEAARRALALDSTVAQGYAALGWVDMSSRRWEGAERNFRVAIALDPTYADAHGWYSHLLAQMGRREEALVEARWAQKLDPLSPVISTMVSQRLREPGRNDEAVAAIERAHDLDPDYLPWVKVGILMSAGRREEARTEADRLLALPGRDLSRDLDLVTAGYTLAQTGDEAGARDVLRTISAAVAAGVTSPVMEAAVYVGLGHNERALERIEAAAANPQPFHAENSELTNNSRLDPLRSDPRFQRALERMGFTDAIIRRR